jgi:hypothetical protein
MNRIGIGVVVFVVGCSAAPLPVATQEGLRITTQDPSSLAGELGRIRFHAARSEAQRIDIRFELGDKVTTLHLDDARGEGDFDAGGEHLTPDDVAGLDQLGAALNDVLPSDPALRTRVEDAVVRATSHLSMAPVDTPLPPFHFVAEQGWVHLSCSCSRQYIGSGYYRTAGKGGGCTGGSGSGCKGRCGKGCGPDNLKWPWSWGSGVYTRDCAKHDYGLGSWQSAFDDYSFASPNCG